jgi:uroporphyrinogen decarboxylase
MEMSGRERVLLALSNEQPDRVPIFDFLYSRKLYKHVLGSVPESYNAEDVMNCSRRIGYDMAAIPFGGVAGFRNEEDGNDIYGDEWGTTYRRDPGTWPVDAPVDFPLKDRSDWINYSIPDPDLPQRLNNVKMALRMAQQSGIAVVGIIRGPLSATWMLFGLEQFCLLLYEDPQLLDEVLSRVTDFFIHGGNRMIDEGVDAICFADDYGGSESTLISPAHFQKHILPQIKRLVSSFRRRGVNVIMHSDGFIMPLLDLIIPIGINAYHPVQRKAHMNLGEVKHRYGESICLLGNVDNTTTLVSGTREQVREQTIECLRIGASQGGHILASDHSLHDDIPLENIFELYETGRRFGKYPIRI